jgi:hypothetical protein
LPIWPVACNTAWFPKFAVYARKITAQPHSDRQ